MSAERITVDLPSGAVEVSAEYSRPDHAWATLAIAHGAGAGHQHPFLVGFAEAVADAGVAALRFAFPYVEAGRRMPGPAAHAIATWGAVMRWLENVDAPRPMWAGGKSYGGRMASMAAAEGTITPAGLVYLGYPLHPPGEPAKARVAHLPAVVPPQLFVEGTRDPFIDPHEQLLEAVASCQDAREQWIEGGGHSFEVKGRKLPADRVGAELAAPVVAFLRSRGV